MAKLPIADDFEALAAATLTERGPVPIKASKGRTRLLKVVDKSGAVVGVTTHGKVLEGAARVAEIEIAVQEGRPEEILCGECRCLVPVKPKGKIPVYCPACSPICATRKQRAKDVEKARRRNRESIRLTRAKDPEEARRKSRESARKRRAKKADS